MLKLPVKSYCAASFAEFHTDEIHIDHEEPVKLPPLLEEADNAEKLLRKPTKFEMMRRFKSRKSKRKSQIMHPTHLTEVSRVVCYFSVDEIIQMKATEQCFPVVLFNLLYKVLLTFESVDEILKCDPSNESY